MSQDNKSRSPDELQRQAEPAETGHEEGSATTKSAEARIWAAATKLIRDANEPFEKEQ